MENSKIIKTAVIIVVLILAAALISVGIIMISRRQDGGPDTQAQTDSGRETETMESREISTDPADYTAVVSDTLRIGSASSEKEHSLVLTGAAGKKTVGTKTGTLEKDYDVVSFEKKGAAAEWKMSAGDGGKAGYVLFEVSEVHQSNLEAFAYTVFVDGKAAYYRTYEQISSSPNHWFFAVPVSDIENTSDFSVKIVSDTDNVFSVSGIAVYTDFFDKIKEQGIDGDLMLYLHSAGSLDKAKEHVNDFSGAEFENFDLGLMFKLNYFASDSTTASTAEFLANILSYAAETGMPVQLMPSLSWSAPYDIPDGKGGSFADVKYGQVLYNSLTGEFVDSTPNAYGSTPWESWGEPTLLSAQKLRIADVMTYVNGYLSNSAASGGYGLGLNTLIEHSVVYKGPLPQSSYYKMGLIDGGDFNAAVIAAARADGVTLDPTDGLSYEEKLWMNTYQAKYVQSLADTYQEAFGTDPVIVRNGTVTYPERQMMNNIFSHTVQWVDQTPSHGDLRISGWKSGIGTGFYEASEEFALIDDIRFYQYRVAYGKTGNCNFEMSSLNESETFAESITKLYEAGVDFITLFNDERGYRTASKLASLDKTIATSEASAPVHYDESVLWVDYNRDIAEDGLLTEKFGVVGSENAKLDRSNGTLMPGSDGDAYVIYRVSSGTAWENGIYLDLEAYANGTPKINIYAGSGIDSLESVGTFRYDRSQSNSFNRYSVYRFDMSEATKGLDEYYIKISFEGNKAENVQVKAVNVRRVASDVTGPKNDLKFTKLEARLMNLWVARREEANRLIEAYVDKNDGADGISEAAAALNGMGCPVDAMRLISKEISLVLPAKFAIQGEGPLGTLPVYVRLSRSTFTGSVTVNGLSATGADFTVFSTYQLSSSARTFEITFSGLEKGKYVLENTDWNRYSLKKDADGEYETDADGKLTVRVTAEYERLVGVTELSGRVKSYSGGTLRLIVQDPAVSRWFLVSIPADGTAVLERRADGEEEGETGNPVAGDYATVKLDGDGKLISCDAVYGVKTGVIKSFTPPDLTKEDTTNGLIEFEDGSVFEIEYQAGTTAITFDGGETTAARTLTDAQLVSAFRAGREITITYCPEYYGEYRRVLTAKD